MNFAEVEPHQERAETATSRKANRERQSGRERQRSQNDGMNAKAHPASERR
jgi:hypothetical protein